jgi:ubiquinone/menaquinone biosynthesis C-methylase UbiE/DNA-binding transcriptional ArsR family regulator
LHPDEQMNETSLQPKALLSWMDGLADVTRLRLLRLLERQELGVAELCDVLQMPQSTVSRHLKLLSDMAWVRSRRQGTTNLYTLSIDEVDAPARRLWALAREQAETWATHQQDQVRLTRLLRQRQEQTQTFFAGAAAEWDRLRGELYGSSFTTRSMLALLPAHWTVVDLGCGTGAVAAELATMVERVVGIDNSEAMLKAARKRTADLTNVQLRKGELTALPLDNASADAALMLLVLTYLPEPTAALKEAARVIKPGGRLVVTDLLRHDREDFRRQMGQQCMGFTGPEIQALLTRAGFSRASVRPLPSEPGAKGPALLLATATRT